MIGSEVHQDARYRGSGLKNTRCSNILYLYMNYLDLFDILQIVNSSHWQPWLCCFLHPQTLAEVAQRLL